MSVGVSIGETKAVTVKVGEKVYIKGDPGFSPTIEVTDITGGHRLTITDINGDKTVDVMNGAKGDKGDTGNGIEYIMLNADYTLTVHYTNGTEWTSTSIRGEKGDKGDTGDTGPTGQPGQTGATPDISIGTVTTGAAGSQAEATMTGTPEQPVLNLTIPRGDPGEVTQAEFDALADEVADQKSAIEALEDLTNRKAGMLVDTVSGSIASFVPDATIDNLLGVSVAVEPVQDLHGYDHPWPAGGGKNLFNKDAPGKQAGYALDYNTGAPYQTSSGNYSVSDFIPVVAGQNYIASGNAKATDYCWYTSAKAFVSGGGDINTARTAPSNAAFLRIDYWKANENAVQLEAGSTATAYAPFENLCPISGWSAVGIEAAGKNLLENVATTGTINGVTFTVNADGSVTAQGTATSQVQFFMFGTTVVTDNAKTFPFDVAASIGVVGSSTTFRGVLWTDLPDGGGERNYFLDGAEATIPAKSLIKGFALRVMSGVTVNTTFYPMLRPAPVADATYSPYQGNRYTITLGQTVYGGTLDATAGTLTVDRVIVTYADSTGFVSHYSGRFYYNGLPQGLDTGKRTEAISNEAKYGDYQNVYGAYFSFGGAGLYINKLSAEETIEQFSARLAANPFQICYYLSTPIEISLDPVTIATIANQINNVWADAGDVTVEYAADIKAYIDRLNQPTEDDMIANSLIQSGKYFTVNNRLFLSTASIAAGAQIIPGHNCTETSLVEALNALNA